MSRPDYRSHVKSSLLAFACITWVGASLCGSFTVFAADRDWPTYLGDKARSHFSPLDQINTRNGLRLEPAWTYHSCDAREDNQSQIQCNPLIVDGVLYGTTPQIKLVALQAATGQELWRFDPFAGARSSKAVGINRGVVYFFAKTAKTGL
jgi:quinoprotein glucose dehydrogenase